MTKKSIKVLAVATLSLSALGTAAVLPTTHADAASITQKSGNESVGKIEAITNTFKTFDTAENFAFGELPKILKGQSYKSHVFPAAQTGYNVSATIDYDALTSKSEAQNLANKVVQAADVAIAAEAKADTAKPAEPNKPADNTVTPAEPNKPADNTVTPAEPNKPVDNTVTPAEPNKPSEDVAKPSESTKPVDGSVQADTTKPATDLVKPDKPGEQPAKPTDKPADKLIDKKEITKTEKSNKSTNTTEAQKDIGKEVLPNTGESFSNSVLLGSILALFGLAITYKFKLSKK